MRTVIESATELTLAALEVTLHRYGQVLGHRSPQLEVTVKALGGELLDDLRLQLAQIREADRRAHQ